MGTTLAAFHPETPPCHSEPFGVLRINSAKNLCGSSNYKILRRPAGGGTPQNDVEDFAPIQPETSLIFSAISRLKSPTSSLMAETRAS
jgi:hypothetical protein